MASQAVVAAVNTRLEAAWTTLPVIGPNLQGEPPADGSAFLTVQYPVASEQQKSIGAPAANVWREEGAIRFVLAIERGQGVDQGLQWADALRALFRGKQFSGVTTYAPSPPVIDDSNDDGLYWKLTFVVSYYFDIIG